MVLRHPDEIKNKKDELKKFIFGDWNYGRTNYSSENPFYSISLLKNIGVDTVICSSSRSFNDPIYCGSSIHTDNIIDSVRNACQNNLLGHCVSSWGVRRFNYETQLHNFALAPLTSASPHLDSDILKEQAVSLWGGIDSSVFYQATELTASPFIFNKVTELGIQWNGLKDHLPAPPNFIAEYLKTISQEENIKLFATAEDNLLKAIESFKTLNSSLQGESLLIQYWLEAAQMELKHLKMSRSIITKDPKGLEIAIKLREKSEKMAFRWQTPVSARINASSLYDPAIQYLSQL